ncbi:MAG: chromosomal replication initiator protein DnaA, partial [Deltaproteobacteria bacterium HGW-Deltaproteobacteria-1]
MESVWDKATKIIQDKVTKQNFDTWIKPIKIVAMEDKCIQLAVPNKFFKDWLMDNYLSMIKNTLHSVIGISVDIDFILSRDKEKKPEAAVLPFEQERNQAGNSHSSRNKNISFLNGNYTFDRFVVGPSNQFAHAASIAVAKQPAKNYNPLFIYGGSGLGKTHLLNAIGLMTTSSHPDLNVMYVSAEAFMNEMINSIRYDRMSKFREKYRNIGSLLIDDIHFL